MKGYKIHQNEATTRLLKLDIYHEN